MLKREKKILCRSIMYAMFIISFLVPQFSLAQAQAPTDLGRSYIPPSPQAASLGTYAVTPVDFYTGVPDIRIPLYDIKLKGFQLNVNLSYHAGGIRITEESGNVGLKWALNSGGVITRTIRHKDDLGTNGFYQVNPATRPCSDSYDQEPDMFYYNFGGYSGKFMINYISSGNYVIRKLPQTGMFIFIDAGNNFKIMDENGITYWFEQKEMNNSYSTQTPNSFNDVSISSWYLTRIITTYGEQITFSYNNTGNRFQTLTKSYSTTQYNGVYPPDLWTFGGYTIGGLTAWTYQSQYTQSSQFVRDTYSNTDEILPTSITFPGGAIKFYTSTRLDCKMSTAAQGLKIDRVEILKGYLTGARLKAWELKYDYYSSGSTQPDNISKRLRLLSVQETGQVENITYTAQTLPPYTFSYNTSILPDKNAQISQIEGFMYPAESGLLTRINFPTGGFNSYSYEPHYGGVGARILSSIQNDGLGYANKRTYEYIGGKRLGQYIGFEQIPSTSNFNVELGASTLTATTFYITTFGSSIGVLGESSSNYPIGYDKVIEYIGDNGDGGKTEIDFNNFANPLLAMGVPQEIATVNGLPLAKSEFSKKNGVYILLQKHTYNYGINNSFSLSLNRRFNSSCNKGYRVLSDWIALNSEQDIIYDENGSNPITNSRSYTYGGYPNHYQPTQIMETDSKGLSLKTVNTYVWEKSALTPYSLMTGKNLSGILIEQTKYLNNVQIEKNTTSHKDWFGDQKIIAPWIITKQVGTGSSKDVLAYNQYDGAGNPLEVIKSDGITISYVWDYSKNYMIAECKNAKVSDIAFTDFEAEDLGGWSMTTTSHILGDQIPATGRRYFSGTLFKNGLAPNTYVVTLWGKQNGTQTVNGALGQTLYTMGNWALRSWQITNPTNVTIVADLCDNVRLHPANAEMTTWTYDNLVGVTAMANIRNRLSFYEYDGMNRLIVVRDQDKKITKKICYTYTGVAENCNIYSNSDQTAVFIKNNCGTGYNGSAFTYTVPANTYFSTISTEDANAQALADANGNGQNYANANASCNVSCSFSTLTGFTKVGSNIVTTGTTVSGYFIFYSSGLMQPNTQYTVANITGINGACKPSVNRVINTTASGRSWQITFTSTGQMIWQMIGGVALPANSTVALNSFSYNL